MAMLFKICLLCLLAVPVARLQPFNVTARPFSPGLLEARQRNESMYDGFVYKFSDNATKSDVTPNGFLQPNQVNTNPFLSTLPGDGNGQALVTLGPCAGNTPHTHPRGSEIKTHTHPRGSEISFLLYGAIQFGMVEENAGNNELVLRNFTQNETIHVPQGLLHFSYNPTCQPAAFLANFATRDPGTQTMWGSLMRIPNRILNSATGIPEATFQSLKARYPLVGTQGTGGEECLARCNLAFAASNNLTALADTS